MRIFLFLSVLISASFPCKTEIDRRTYQLMDKTYLALGDSYTVGEAVLQEDSFPYQLVIQLNAAGVKTKQPRVIAVTGWTSANLIAGLEKAKVTQKYDIVTLLIGVNNQYRKQSIETYRRDLVCLLNTAISHSGRGRSSVFVLSIPDWGVTPFGQLKNPQEVSTEIDNFNDINKQEALRAGVHYADITPGSRLAANDQSLTARDGLHPSGKMYSLWVKQLLPVVKKELY